MLRCSNLDVSSFLFAFFYVLKMPNSIMERYIFPPHEATNAYIESLKESKSENAPKAFSWENLGWCRLGNHWERAASASLVPLTLVFPRFAKLLLRLPALRSIGLKCLEHLFFFKLIGDTPIDTFLMEMLETPLQVT